MKITMSEDAKQWFKHEMEVKANETVRFFVRYGGASTLHTGFSLGVTKEDPINIGYSTEIDNVTYFIEEKDLWYFKDHNLHVSFDDKWNEPSYEYMER
ncbi:HesB/YadR/YfhF family protein [Mangrovibacillus cuniculi]|uniref:FeS cluster biogenesis domain-containing protein n=1 Tax=Mangrovibacillus cuniculi TaxID=2593652 RepID=A0A7S8CAN8_9BACI|nr:HesB/YadR/YfhF family protein [Mangrovibacillus cuniculi]QPC46473.1 hypothetical protein G8O30_05585 [Mangrovibacillus cuniculi]